MKDDSEEEEEEDEEEGGEGEGEDTGNGCDLKSLNIIPLFLSSNAGGIE
jgi:hypothetical protein